MSDNCKNCDKVIGHIQYNCCDGLCKKCYNNPYRKLEAEDGN